MELTKKNHSYVKIVQKIVLFPMVIFPPSYLISFSIYRSSTIYQEPRKSLSYAKSLMQVNLCFISPISHCSGKVSSFSSHLL